MKEQLLMVLEKPKQVILQITIVSSTPNVFQIRRASTDMKCALMCGNLRNYTVENYWLPYLCTTSLSICYRYYYYFGIRLFFLLSPVSSLHGGRCRRRRRRLLCLPFLLRWLLHFL